jgi:cytoskeletal protein CcmA (bactofilin family)
MNSVTGDGTDWSNGKVPDSVSGTLSVWGEVRFLADAVLRARVQGNVESAEKLVVTQESEISGSVKGVDVCVEGKIEGGLEATGNVWVRSGGVLHQRCVAHALRMDSGAQFRGELRVGAVPL